VFVFVAFGKDITLQGVLTSVSQYVSRKDVVGRVDSLSICLEKKCMEIPRLACAIGLVYGIN
jgi:hypothetical protein